MTVKMKSFESFAARFLQARPAAGIRRVAAALLMLGGVPGYADAQGAPVAGAVVSGAVDDSIARRRIAGASVQLVNADNPSGARPLVTTSDSSGRFTVNGVPAGLYHIGFYHAALDTLGLELPTRVIQVGADPLRVDLATPSPRTVMRSLCPTANPDSTGLFMGSVRATESQASIEGASLIVEWSEFVLDGVRVYERPRTVTGRTTGPGFFAFCGLPPDGGLHVRVAHGADSSGYVEVQVPANALRYQTFLVGGSSRVVVASIDSASGTSRGRTVARGEARLTGMVVDTAGRPVANAHALVWGTNLDVQTNERGAFAIDGLPGGTQTLEIRVIGYVPVTRIVHLAASRPTNVEVTLDRAAVILATETVRGRVVYSRALVEFDRRRNSGLGKYLTSDMIARRPNARLGSLLQGMLGVTVRQSGGRSEVTMRGNTGSSCTPSLYVDGNRDLSGDFDYLFTDEIAGVEIYSRENQRPPQYNDSNHCGAVLVWTRPRGR